MPSQSPAPRKAWSILDAMAATAAAAVLMAGYRLEVGGCRGAGLVPACAFLVSCLWLRDARTAWKAAGVPLGFLHVFIVAPLAGVTIVATANLAFFALADLTLLLDAIRAAPDAWGWGGAAEGIVATSWVAIAGIITIWPTLLIAGLWRRIFWRVALSPTARPPAVGEATAAGDLKPEPEPLPAAAPVWPSD